MSKVKKYDSFKKCELLTSSDRFFHVFSSDWTFTEIKDWMLDTFCVSPDSIVDLTISSVTIYKNDKNIDYE